jgi:hypothetical protein
MSDSDYEINEKDIDSALSYLKIHHPEDATPEKAIAMLEELKAGVHMLAHTDPEKLEEIYNALKRKN